MAVIRVLNDNSVSANHHVYVDYNRVPTSVSTGLANSQTLTYTIPVEVRDTRLTFTGNFGSGSASSQVMVDISPGRRGSAFVNILSVSAPMTTTIPIQVDHVVRFRHAFTSAAVSISCSVNVWIG